MKILTTILIILLLTSCTINSSTSTDILKKVKEHGCIKYKVTVSDIEIGRFVTCTEEAFNEINKSK